MLPPVSGMTDQSYTISQMAEYFILQSRQYYSLPNTLKSRLPKINHKLQVQTKKKAGAIIFLKKAKHFLKIIF